MKRFAVLVLLLAACGDAAAPGDTAPITVPTTTAPATIALPDPDEVIFEVHRGGGLCVDGPCSTTYSVYGDGRVELNGEGSMVIAEGGLAALVAELAAGSGQLRPFTGTCPEAYDGPRYTYRFQGSEIDSCVSDVTDSNLIQQIHAILQLGSPYG